MLVGWLFIPLEMLVGVDKFCGVIGVPVQSGVPLWDRGAAQKATESQATGQALD
jgi:hypothetical protein